jgi:hypothetical protein
MPSAQHGQLMASPWISSPCLANILLLDGRATATRSLATTTDRTVVLPTHATLFLDGVASLTRAFSHAFHLLLLSHHPSSFMCVINLGVS